MGSKKKEWGLHFPGPPSLEECSHISRQQGERESTVAGGQGPGRVPAVLSLAADARGGQLSHRCPRGRWWPTGDLRVVVQCLFPCKSGVQLCLSYQAGKMHNIQRHPLCRFPHCLWSSDCNCHLCQPVPHPCSTGRAGGSLGLGSFGGHWSTCPPAYCVFSSPPPVQSTSRNMQRRRHWKSRKRALETAHRRVLCLTFRKTRPRIWSCSRKSTCFSERLLFPNHEKQTIIFIFKQSNFFYY